MGNNPSRAATTQQQSQQQQQQQQHPPQHHHHHLLQHHQSASSSASASPPPAPSRTSSARRPSYRRNSLHSPVSSAKYSSGSPTAREGGRSDLIAGGGGATEYLPPPPFPPRRESIATSSIAESSNHQPRSRQELFEDVAALRLFPTPPSQPPSATNNPFAPGVNPFARPPPAAPTTSVATGEGIIHRPRRGSVDSTAASLEEEAVPECDARAIPTLIQWPHAGTKVYVTGTFCAWEKRYRLSRSPDDGIMSAIVAIPPGTHHVKFLVDGEMRTSPSLPTAVDDTGILVNYLEVSADDMPPLHRAESPSTAGQHPGGTNRAHEASSTERIPTLPPAESALHYTTEIPSYLRDLDNAEDDLHYVDGAPPPPPPTLPMMLQKVILNGSSSMRDDASVLGIPNHAVLNHLATSSIKNSILAVSATTRYKKKYVTTILYKAATPSED